MNILLVDDDTHLRSVLERLLNEDHLVRAVGSGEEALECLQNGCAFDAIVTDIRMPGMSGLELYEYVKTHFPMLTSRLIFMSGSCEPEVEARIRRLPNAYLEKPFPLDALYTALAALTAAA